MILAKRRDKSVIVVQLKIIAKRTDQESLFLPNFISEILQSIFASETHELDYFSECLQLTNRNTKTIKITKKAPTTKA
jgi:hypothetical protein